MSTEDRSLIDWSFDLVISSTVKEETSWSNTSLLTINYWKEPGPDPFDIKTIYVSPDAPWFNAEPKSSDILQLEESEEASDGNKFVFSPLVFDCFMETWEKSLPPVLDEDQDDRFTVIVYLNRADKFLGYMTYERKF